MTRTVVACLGDSITEGSPYWDSRRRAGDPEGQCSHFVAKAPWITPGQPLRVESTLPLETSTDFVWRDFEAKRYAHHED